MFAFPSVRVSVTSQEALKPVASRGYYFWDRPFGSQADLSSFRLECERMYGGGGGGGGCEKNWVCVT